MRKRLIGITLTAALTALTAATGNAGLNSGAVAHMYWQTASTGAAIAARDNTNGTCQLVVTCTGLTNYAGADCQIILNSLTATGVPAAWQGQTGGCAEGFINGYVGGRGGTIFRNAFSTAPAVAGVLASQNGEFFATGDCKTPHNVGLLWLSAAGGAGQARTAATEYAIWAIAFDLANSVDPVDGVTPCAGGAASPTGMCLYPSERVPCSDPQRPGAMELLDGNLATDFPTFLTGNTFLTWNAGANAGQCPLVDPVHLSTWGALKKLYK